jgi:hypothetical protein
MQRGIIHIVTTGSLALNALCGCRNTGPGTEVDCAAQVASALAVRATSSIDATGPAPAAVFENLKLHGFAYDDAGTRTALELVLQRQGPNPAAPMAIWAGTLQTKDAPPSTLLEIALQALDKTPTQATYRLSYTVDICEHAQADRCSYVPAKTKPRLLSRTEARVSVQTQFVNALGDGPAYVASAVGTELTTLGSAYLLRGLALVAKETP